MSTPGHHTFAGSSFCAAQAHDGIGELQVARVQARAPHTGATWIDLVVVPPGTSIGEHRHPMTDEEVYVVVDGHASMQVDGGTIAVGPGDVVVNRPGGAHGLVNDGDADVRLVVVDLAVTDDGSGPGQTAHQPQ